jgi:hypothetical protein
MPAMLTLWEAPSWKALVLLGDARVDGPALPDPIPLAKGDDPGTQHG